MLVYIFSFLQDCINIFLVNVDEWHNAPLMTHGDESSSPSLALTMAFQKNCVLTHTYHFLPVGLYDQLLTRHCWHQEEEKQSIESHDSLVTNFYWKLYSLLGTREEKETSRVLNFLNTKLFQHLTTSIGLTDTLCEGRSSSTESHWHHEVVIYAEYWLAPSYTALFSLIHAIWMEIQPHSGLYWLWGLGKSVCQLALPQITCLSHCCQIGIKFQLSSFFIDIRKRGK